MQYTKEKLEELSHRWNTPSGKKLLKTIKSSRCYLSPVLFREKVRNFKGINDQEIEDCVDLRGAPLAGFDFRVSIKESDDGFSESIAILSNIHFEGANLKHCNFEEGKLHNCFFENSDLSHAEFKNALINECDFSQADCTAMGMRGTKLITCNFTEAVIRDITLSATVVDQKTLFGKILQSEKDKNYHYASIEYKQIKEMYKNSSLHAIADEYHYREMVAKRKIAPLTDPRRWMNFLFGDLLCKYGTSFWRVLFWSAVFIEGSAVLYSLNESLLYHNTPTLNSTWDSLYFSIVTFTTLGYGDFHAIGALRFLAAAEALVGATMLSLFTVIVARNIIRD